jgi:hypothetical protein
MDQWRAFWGFKPGVICESQKSKFISKYFEIQKTFPKTTLTPPYSSITINSTR